MFKQIWSFLFPERARWTFSGVVIGERNFPSDGGVVVGPRPMSERAALAYLPSIAPRGAVIHVDRVNHIITYKVI